MSRKCTHKSKYGKNCEIVESDSDSDDSPDPSISCEDVRNDIAVLHKKNVLNLTDNENSDIDTDTDNDEMTQTEVLNVSQNRGILKRDAPRGILKRFIDDNPQTLPQTANTSSPQRFSSELTDRIKRAGGQRGSHIKERVRFSGLEIRQRLDLHDIKMCDLRTALSILRHRLTDVVNFSTNIAAPDGVLDVVLRGPSSSSDVCAILNASNSYNAEMFLNTIEQVMQSNDKLLSDESLGFVVTAALNKCGGARRKLGSVAYDQIITKKKACLHNPPNTDTNLCLSRQLKRNITTKTSKTSSFTFTTKKQVFSRSCRGQTTIATTSPQHPN